MERLTHEADFGLEDWEETLFFVKSDPNGAYNIIDIAKYQGEPEFDEILKNVALRLAAYENTGLEPEEIVKIREDIENGYMKSTARRYGVPVDRLRELVNADREGHCVVLPVKLGDTIYSIREDFYNYRKHSGVQRGEVVGFEYDKTWMIWVRLDDAIPRTRHAFKVKDFGKVIFNNREEAELSLKAVEGIKQDGN